MQYPDQFVGEIQLPEHAPAWQIQLAAAVTNVERAEFLSAIDAMATQVRHQARARAIKLARALVSDCGLTEQDVFAAAATAARAPRGPVAVKYRDPETGKTWSGRGVAPRWLAGKNREDFLVG